MAASSRVVHAGRSAYVFLLGRPCSGKTTATRLIDGYLRRKWSVEALLLDDFKRLSQIFKEDASHTRHSSTVDGGVVITDQLVWKELDDYLTGRLGESETGVHLVEFARRAYMPVLRRLSSVVVDRSVFLYISCPFEI